MIHLFVSPKNLFQAFFTHKLDHSPSTNLAMSNSNQPGDVKFQVPSWKRIHENLTR